MSIWGACMRLDVTNLAICGLSKSKQTLCTHGLSGLLPQLLHQHAFIFGNWEGGYQAQNGYRSNSQTFLEMKVG